MTEAVTRLLLVLEEKDQLTIAAMEPNNLIDLNFGLGLVMEQFERIGHPSAGGGSISNRKDYGFAPSNKNSNLHQCLQSLCV